jgi:predicted NBD/HSP70 family sugar kinase
MTGRGSSSPERPASPVVAVGVFVSERIIAGLLIDHKLQGELVSYPAGPAPEDSDEDNSLVELPTDALVDDICALVLQAAKGHEAELYAVGVALPGLVRNGVVEEAPNLPQLKGAHVADLLSNALAARGVKVPVAIVNDADAMAAGLASRSGHLDRMVRVWTIGTGIGYGCYPFSDGVWEAGHSVVTLDDKENFCGCGGRGHLEGIMGHRAMRLRFLDLEPEEVFEAANRRSNPDPRCLEFKHLWHKALAAATATSIHQAGARKFYVTGYNVRFLELNLLKDYLHQMVKMSPLQNYSIEIVEDEHSTRVLGAAVAAEHAAR